MKKFLFLLPLMILLIVSNTVDAKKKKYPNGDYYEGEWKNGKPNGNGKMIFANGDIYEGEWKNGKQDGFGKMTYDTGDIYEGNWKDGEKMEWVRCDTIMDVYLKGSMDVFMKGNG